VTYKVEVHLEFEVDDYDAAQAVWETIENNYTAQARFVLGCQEWLRAVVTEPILDARIIRIFTESEYG
jgi:hypothetical protein